MWTRFLIAPAAAATMLAVSPDVLAVDLKPKTLAAFDRYVKATEERIATEVSGQKPFLWVDRLSASARTEAMARLNQGGVVHEKLQTRVAGKSIDVPDGAIHHWIGTVLMPGVSLANARSVVERYEHYPNVLGPLVQRASIVKHAGDDYVVYMRTRMERVLTVVIDADYHIAYRPIGQKQLYTKSVADNMFQVESAGEPAESKIQGDKSSGFLWRLNTYCSFMETPAGTIEQCESISLTRGIPFGLGWLVGPFVNSIPRETLEFTLGRVREEALKSLKSAKGQ